MNDSTIIAAIRRQNPSAINAVIEQYSKLLWSVVNPILSQASVQDVEECVADVFIYLWQHPEKFEPSRGSLKTWLSIVARSHAIDRCRELSRRNTVSLEEHTPAGQSDVAEAILTDETSQVLADALATLPETEREIVVRRYYHDQKPREIAQALDMPVKGVENRLYRAKQKLRRHITK